MTDQDLKDLQKAWWDLAMEYAAREAEHFVEVDAVCAKAIAEAIRNLSLPTGLDGEPLLRSLKEESNG